jgi:aminopeptidase N
MGVMQAITHIDCPEREKLLQAFYRHWNHEPLIMDKWLLLQAISELPNTVAKVAELLKHNVFDIRNPNKVYALIGGFGNNVIRFNDRNGKGYKLLADVLLQLDKINPQIAAKMANPFAQWRCYDKFRQELMQEQLQRIINTPELSNNLYEIVDKCLQE